VDLLTIGGILLAILAILGGQALEGGSAGSLMQLTAGIIIVGGTLGATMVSYPKADFLRGMKMAKAVFINQPPKLGELLVQIVEMATVARRDGVLALEGKLATIDDPFLKRAISFLVDGVDGLVARTALEAQIDAEAEESTIAAKVFETAGGYSPTVGILGAVLGLIHVMENLSDPSKLGPGIAVAFVATVYGVGLANLLLLPMASKLKRQIGLEKERKTLICEGVLGIQEGLNPRILEDKLRGYVGEHAPPPTEEPKK